jgi:hypothetical protein
MDKTTAQAIHDLAMSGRLSEDVDYEVRDTLGLVSDEEKEAHDERLKAEKEADDDSPQKATGATKKGQ